MRALAKGLAGFDTSLGLILYVAISIVFGEEFSPRYLGLALIASHLPDFDFIPFLLLRKRYGWFSHWPIGRAWYWSLHNPPVTLTVVGLATYVIAQVLETEHSLYVLCLVASGIALHFLLDSTEEQGFALLSPLTGQETRWRLGKKGFKRVSWQECARIYKERHAKRKGTGSLAPWELPFSRYELAILAASTAVLVLFAAH
ncbi:MAG TPA: metal-dependent hydrolase [Candidatus Paceibacterota bacterium]